MPRNRTVRLAVLGSSVQRAAASGYPSSRSSALKRRIVVGLLVLLSLVLITVSFRSSALDGAQGTAAGILRPFEVAADRVSRPFRDAVGWARGLIDARAENKRLRAENAQLRRQVIQDESAVQENVQLKNELNYLGPPSVADFDRVHAVVLTHPLNAIDQSVTIGAGSTNGIRAGSVVVSPTGGLVGTVDRTFAHVAHVTLLTDNQSAVTAIDLTYPTAVGIIQPGGGGSDVLVLDLVSKTKFVGVADTIITAGSLGKGALPSMFPRGIPIGTVTSERNNDVNPFKNIQVKPLVDFSSLQSVIVFVPPR
ncbi:MAG TPA: rod shape-determining protein MreC [Gaiellaceae bacterium]|nr:rod shape-determining protein MreC [Thermoleophilia bacterium]HWJ33304.1 rod shape-determining protein MreC [Gaiellaceae bacterium]